jgi:hypothetical protein
VRMDVDCAVGVVLYLDDYSGRVVGTFDRGEAQSMREAIFRVAVAVGRAM